MNKKSIILWTFCILSGLLLVAIGAFILVLRSERFHDYVLATIIEKTQEATGGRVEVHDYEFDWFRLRGDVHHLIIRGSEPDPDMPLFRADRVRVGLKIISVFRREVDLNELIVDHPVVHLFFDKKSRSNIPRPEVPEKEGRPVDIFDLAVKHFQINQGEIYYDDNKLKLAAEVRDLQAQVDFSILNNVYEGSLAYREGRLQISDFIPLEHTLEADFSAAASGFQLERLLFTTDLSQVSLQGLLTNYADPNAEGVFTADISTQDLGRTFNVASLPAGQVMTSGSVRYKSTKDAPFLERLFLDGRFSSPLLAVRLPQVSSDVRAIQGRFRLEKGNLIADAIQANLLDGHLTADFSMRHVIENPEPKGFCPRRLYRCYEQGHCQKASRTRASARKPSWHNRSDLAWKHSEPPPPFQRRGGCPGRSASG